MADWEEQEGAEDNQLPEEDQQEEEEEDDILDMGDGAATSDREALLMRFCPHDSSMLYPQVCTRQNRKAEFRHLFSCKTDAYAQPRVSLYSKLWLLSTGKQTQQDSTICLSSLSVYRTYTEPTIDLSK
jgi:hypothetical protein